jgi:hypothetical protein
MTTPTPEDWHTPRGADAALAKAFGHLKLEDVLFGLNDVCRAWPTGTVKSALPVLAKSKPGNPIRLPWQIYGCPTCLEPSCRPLAVSHGPIRPSALGSGFDYQIWQR